MTPVRPLACVALSAAAACGVEAPASAAGTPNMLEVRGGRLTITTGAQMQRTLRAAGVSTFETQRTLGRIIQLRARVGGTLDPQLDDDADLAITEGYSFRRQRRGVRIEHLRFTFGRRTGIVRGSVKGRSIALFEVDATRMKTTRPDPLHATATGVRLTLTAAGARTLNRGLGTAVFRANREFGSMDVSAFFRTVLVTSGQLRVAFDGSKIGPSSTTGVLASAVAPAVADGAQIVFPVAGMISASFKRTGARSLTVGLQGLQVQGGMTFSRGTSSLALTASSLGDSKLVATVAGTAGQKFTLSLIDRAETSAFSKPNTLTGSTLELSAGDDESIQALDAVAGLVPDDPYTSYSPLHSPFGTGPDGTGPPLGTAQLSGTVR